MLTESTRPTLLDTLLGVRYNLSMAEEKVIPILRVKDAAVAVEWYRRLGFEQTSVHRFGPNMPAFVTIERGEMKIFLSEHLGEARPDTLLYMAVSDVYPIAKEFGEEVEEAPWGFEIAIRDPDMNRLRIGMPKAARK